MNKKINKISSSLENNTDRIIFKIIELKPQEIIKESSLYHPYEKNVRLQA